jgi:hypothetical protein
MFDSWTTPPLYPNAETKPGWGIYCENIMTYTPEQAQEIIARIAELRGYWLRAVETQLIGRRQRDMAELESSSRKENLQSYTLSD